MATKTVINGVDLETVNETTGAIRTDPALAQSRFHVVNKWINGGHNHVTIRDFYGAKQEIPHSQVFELDEDEPAMLAGTGAGPQPVEDLLTALSRGMTRAVVQSAAPRGNHIESLEGHAVSGIDLPGFPGVS
nr:OsmC family peroxiredoxin [Planctomycetota bacterium]